MGIIEDTFTGGESEYSIRPDVPILANAPGDISLLKPGAAVFVITLKKPDGTVTCGTALCRERRDQAADMTHPHPPAPDLRRVNLARISDLRRSTRSPRSSLPRCAQHCLQRESEIYAEKPRAAGVAVASSRLP
jgi:hypothetical protein